MNERNGIQEEIHGVGCLAPEEDPFLVENSLKKLSIELDELILPAQKKLAYLQSQQFEETDVNKIDFEMRIVRYTQDCIEDMRIFRVGLEIVWGVRFATADPIE